MKVPRSQSEVRYARAQGRMIHQRRVGMGMSRRHLSINSGVAYDTVSRVEMGDTTARVYDLAMLARALCVDISELCPDPDFVQPKPPAHQTIDAMLVLASRLRTGGAFA